MAERTCTGLGARVVLAVSGSRFFVERSSDFIRARRIDSSDRGIKKNKKKIDKYVVYI